MTMHAKFSAALAAAALLALAPSAARAQSGIADVVMAGRANGTEVPATTIEWMRSQGQSAFEFQGVWKARAAQVVANRAAFDAMNRERPSRGAVSIVTTDELQAASAVLDGTLRMPLLLGRPSDASAPHSAASYNLRMFGTGAAYSLTTLYSEMSNGAFDFVGDVIDWRTLPSNSAFYYNNTNPNLAIFGKTPNFLQDVLTAADPTVNFGLYDNDGPDGVPNSGDDDGYVDLAAFMYPAIGRECGSAGTGIWAHRWFMSAWGVPNFATNDVSAEGGTIRVRDYIIQGGLNCDGQLQDIGVVAHEAGHGFGIPDLYDTDATTNVSNGIGEWGLMGSGNWNQPHSPAHMEAHSKAMLGWINVVTIQADTTLVIEPIFETFTAYRVNIAGVAREYFMLENRQRLGSDLFLNGTGLLIWHVDSVTYANGMNSNSVNANQAHKGLDLEEADGEDHLDISANNAINRGDAGDPWPGSSNRTTFNAASTPSSNTYSSGASNVAITNIVETAGGDITLSINIPDLVTYGDVNDDDAVTVADLTVVMQYAIGATGPDYSRIDIADVDNDNDVDARDAFIIDAFLDGKPTTGFRVGQQGVE